MKLTENPFAILKASPADNRRRLTEKADEAALLGGASVDDALMNLMQMNRRIAAEVSWFPGTHPKAADAFIVWAKTLSAGQTVPMPPLDGFRSPLAQANALVPFFELWPSSRPEYAVGLFRSLDMILSEVTTAGELELINQDRQAGGWEVIPDELALAGPLEDRLREICQIVRDRMEQVPSDETLLNLINRLFAYESFDPLGLVGKTVTDAWAMRSHDREEETRRQLIGRLGQYKEKDITEAQLDSLRSDIGQWCAITAPLRKSAGPIRREARTICHEMRERIVWYVNHAPALPQKMSKKVPVPGGVKTITVSWQSKKEAFRKAISLSEWLAGQFPEQTDQVMLLDNDRKVLENAMVREEAGAHVALDKVNSGG